jgi:hypothetical protein
MTKQCLIQNGKVVQIEDNSFEVSAPLRWEVDITDTVQLGWLHDGDSFIDPGTPAAPVIEETKIQEIAKNEAGHKHPHNINYKTELAQSLYPKREFTFGALTKVEWFSDVALTDKVIQVDIAYNYDPLGFATDRTTTRYWYNTDGSSFSEAKVTYKDYTINPQDQLDEAILRRTNILRQAEVTLIGLVPPLTIADPAVADATALQIKQDGIDFFELYELETSQYRSVGSQNLENVIKNLDLNDPANAQYYWFATDATSLGITGVSDMRDWIIYQLSMGQRNAAGDIV